MKYAKRRGSRLTKGASRAIATLGWSLLLLAAMSALNQCAAAESPSGDRANGSHRLLLVDDASEFGYEPYDADAPRLMEALDACGFEYDVFDISEMATVPTIGVLGAYDAVVWTSGDTYYPTLAYSATESVVEYLDSGGAMFISSQWFADYNYESVMMSEYLHIAFDARTKPYLMQGVYGDPIASGMDISLETLPAYRQYEYAIQVRPLDESAEIITVDPARSTLSGTAVRVPSDHVSSDYRVVMICFPFEAMADAQSDPEIRNTFLSRTLDWLLDASAPSVKWTYPPSGVQIPYSNAVVSLELADIGTGVDRGSLEMLINGEAVAPAWRQLLHTDSLLYAGPGPYAPGSSVQIQVSCQDRYRTPNRMAPYTFSFSVAQDALADITPPMVTEYGPTGTLTGAEASLRVFASLNDTGTGVDAASLAMTVNGDPVITHTERSEGLYTIWYAKPGGYGFGRIYGVEVTGQDLSSPPNTMEPLRFSFSLPGDTFAPYVAMTDPPNGSLVDLDEQLDRGICIWLKDFNGGVDVSSVRLKVNGRSVGFSTRSIFHGLKVIYYPPSTMFDYGQEVVVEVQANDTAYPPNAMDKMSWGFKFDEDRTPPRATAMTPRNRSRRVPRNIHLFVSTSRDTDPTCLTEDLISAECDELGRIDGQILFDPNVPYIHFAPHSYLPSGATISVTVSGSLSDTRGNEMGEPYQYRFWTGGDFDYDPPPVPKYLSGSVGNGAINLSWQQVGGSDYEFYRVYYDSDGCCEPYEGTDADQGPSPISVRNASSLQLTGLDNSKTYHIAVTSMDACANESDYCIEEFVASPTATLDAPVLESAISGNGSAYLEWRPSENLSVTGYLVYYAVLFPEDRSLQSTGEHNWVEVGLATSYKLQGLSDESVYEVWVTAHDDAGTESVRSNTTVIRPSSDVDWVEFRLPGVKPSGRSGHRMVLDPVRKRVYLLGGVTLIQEQELNALNLTSLEWEAFRTTGPAPQPGDCFAEYDETRDVIWMVDSTLCFYELRLPEHEWTAFEPVGEPPEFEDAPGLVLPECGFLDTTRNRWVFYGCYSVEADPPRMLKFHTFDLESHEWSRVECEGNCPSEVHLQASTFIPTDDRFYMFGGISEEGMSSRTYMLDPDSLRWMTLPSLGSPPLQRHSHAMAYDPDFKRLISFGGEVNDWETNFPYPTNEVHAFDFETNEWNELSDLITGIPPSPRLEVPILIIPSGYVGPGTYLLTYGGQIKYSNDSLDDLHALKLHDFSADTTPPAAVTDLTASVVGDSDVVRLQWSAPGDDGTYGRASNYDVRYADSPIRTDTEFEAAASVPILCFPSYPGTMENMMLNLPYPDSANYFALKASDEAGNTSELSNCAGVGLAAEHPGLHKLEDGALLLGGSDFLHPRATFERDHHHHPNTNR